MPVSSPGVPSKFTNVLPGRPSDSLQTVATLLFRQQRYIAYISGRQLNILSAPNVLVQAITFGDELRAVIAQKEEGGRLAVSTGRDVFVLDPRVEGWTRIWWEQTLQLRREDAADAAHWLCWGGEDEVLVGGSHALSLFSSRISSRQNSPAGVILPTQSSPIIPERAALWSITVASPLLFAEFSPSATLIATCAPRDHLVKIWRRLSFEEGLFDYAYLPHPAMVTHIQWRREADDRESRRNSGMSWRHEENPEILYTVASDGLLRVWRTGGLHDAEILSLDVSIDLVHAIPSLPTLAVKEGAGGANKDTRRPPRYVFFISAEQLQAAVRTAVGLPGQADKFSHAVEHLKEIVSQAPDVVVALDGQGRMSAWGLQSIGHKRRPEDQQQQQHAFPNPYHIAHAEGLPLTLRGESPALFAPWFEGDRLHLLTHEMSPAAEITWWTADIETFLSPAAVGAERLQLQTTWCGPGAPVTALRYSADKTLVSRSLDDEVAWVVGPTPGRVRRMTPAAINSMPTRLVSVSVPDAPGATVSYEDTYTVGAHCVRITEAGQVQRWNARSSTFGDAGASATRLFESSISKPSAFAVNAHVAAIISSDGKELVIIELADGYIEHRQQFEQPIRTLILSDTKGGQRILAIAFDQTVAILMRRRYGSDAAQDSGWLIAKSLSLAGIGVNIAAMAWTTSRTLAIGGGNSILLADTGLTQDDAQGELRELLNAHDLQTDRVPLSLLNQCLMAPLPLWAPESLGGMVTEGQFDLLCKILKQLTQTLKFWSSGEPLELNLDAVVCQSELRRQKLDIDQDTLHDLQEQLAERTLPQITQKEQKDMVHVIDTIAFLREHVNSLDLNAIRYLFAWKLELLRNNNADLTTQTNGSPNAQQPTNPIVPEMTWRCITFASHSTTQQTLLDILTLHYNNKLTWPIARALGLLAWLTERTATRSVFEQIAQSAYRSQSPPDPVDAALYYLALRKKATLAGLWRIATWHKEQKATTTFLKRDFAAQADARTAARKNAYALLGKRRFAYAAAFFLLADDAGSAVNALAAQCEDLPLAVAVARVYAEGEGDAEHDYGGEGALQQLIAERVLPAAVQSGDRWLQSWCHGLCGQNAAACEVLIAPLSSPPEMTSVKHWRQDDPSVVLLYQQLRRGASAHEYRALVRSARILRQRGLWTSAVRLTAGWKFLPPAPPAGKLNGEQRSASGPETLVRAAASPVKDGDSVSRGAAAETPSLLDSFSQLQVTDDPPPVLDEKTAREAKAAALLAKIKAKAKSAAESVPPPPAKKPPPTQFKEPDANSLLDSFGF